MQVLSIIACGNNNLADYYNTAEDYNLRTTAPRLFVPSNKQQTLGAVVDVCPN